MRSDIMSSKRGNRWALAGASLAIASCFSNESMRAAADPFKDGRIAIIHANQSAIIDNYEIRRRNNLLQDLQEAGVKVIGRYLARCREDRKGEGRWTKQLIHGGADEKEETDAILDRGFGLISIYQYKSSEDTGPIKFTRGLSEEQGQDCEVTDASAQISKRHVDEGELDSQAAVKQAHSIGQPANTPIYFAIDYDFKAKDQEQARGILQYFREVKTELSKKENGYLVGAYGDGDALDLLQGNNDQKEVLIDFAWLSPSHSFSGNSKFFNLGRWHLAHAQAENTIGLTNSGKCFEYEYDVDIQNSSAEYRYVGAWDRLGRYFVPPNRTTAIFDQHRFVCNIRNLAPGPLQKTCKGALEKIQCSISSCFARFVRVKPTDLGRRRSEVSIDFRDYGRFDGRSPTRSLTRSLSEKPLWDGNDRLKQNCTCFDSNPHKPCK
jgi:hypothetical protein